MTAAGSAGRLLVSRTSKTATTNALPSRWRGGMKAKAATVSSVIRPRLPSAADQLSHEARPRLIADTIFHLPCSFEAAKSFLDFNISPSEIYFNLLSIVHSKRTLE